MTTTTRPDTMTAITACGNHTADPSGALIAYRTLEIPEPGPDEVLVAVRAFSINRGELALLAVRDAGWRPGQDIAGEVVAVGDRVSDIRVGQRVAALIEGAGWAEYAIAARDRLALIPDELSYAQAAAVPMAGTTALNLVRLGGNLLGLRALVTGASGGVGGFAVQLLALSGAEVIAQARSEHAERLAELGASQVVQAVDDRLTPVDFALESVGGPNLADTIARIVPGGTIVIFGNSSGQPTPIDVLGFIGGHEDARLQSYFSYLHGDRAGANLVVLLDLAARGRLRIEIGRQESWRAAADALSALAQRCSWAKTVLAVD